MCLAICHERRRVPRPFRALLRPDVLPGAEENPASREQPAAEPLVGGFEHTEVIVVHVDVVIALGGRAETERILRGPLKAVVADDEPAIVLGERGEPDAGQRLPVLRHRRAEERRNMCGIWLPWYVAMLPATPNNAPVSGLAPMIGATTNMRSGGASGSTGRGRGGLFRIARTRSPTSVSASGAADSACPASARPSASTMRSTAAATMNGVGLASTGDLTIAALQSSSSSSTVKSRPRSTAVVVALSDRIHPMQAQTRQNFRRNCGTQLAPIRRVNDRWRIRR